MFPSLLGRVARRLRIATLRPTLGRHRAHCVCLQCRRLLPVTMARLMTTSTRKPESTTIFPKDYESQHQQQQPEKDPQQQHKEKEQPAKEQAENDQPQQQAEKEKEKENGVRAKYSRRIPLGLLAMATGLIGGIAAMTSYIHWTESNNGLTGGFVQERKQRLATKYKNYDTLLKDLRPFAKQFGMYTRTAHCIQLAKCLNRRESKVSFASNTSMLIFFYDRNDRTRRCFGTVDRK